MTSNIALCLQVSINSIHPDNTSHSLLYRCWNTVAINACVNAGSGFLTTYTHTYFIKYLSPDCYAVTDAFTFSAAEPNVPEVLYCECCRLKVIYSTYGFSS